MRLSITAVALFFFALAGCTSPEGLRSRGGGPGADVGNRTQVVEMHEGSKPFNKTPQLIRDKYTSLAATRDANTIRPK